MVSPCEVEGGRSNNERCDIKCAILVFLIPEVCCCV